MTGRDVTALIVVRNGERYLSEALASIAAQTHPCAEILVVDGQSSDGTVEIARLHGARIVTQSSRGIADAYNLGVAAAQTDLIAFLSHDDRWLPRKIELQTKWLAEHPEAGGVVCRVRHFLDDENFVPPGFRRELLHENPVAFVMESLLVRKALFQRVGGFDNTLTTAEDVDWFARVKDAGVIVGVVDKVLLEKRVHRTNASLTDTQENRNLLRALRASIARKKGPA